MAARVFHAPVPKGDINRVQGLERRYVSDTLFLHSHYVGSNPDPDLFQASGRVQPCRRLRIGPEYIPVVPYGSRDRPQTGSGSSVGPVTAAWLERLTHTDTNHPPVMMEGLGAGYALPLQVRPTVSKARRLSCFDRTDSGMHGRTARRSSRHQS